MQEKIKVFEDVPKSPVQWGAFEGTFTREVEATKNIKEYQRISKIHGYTHQARVLCDIK